MKVCQIVGELEYRTMETILPQTPNIPLFVETRHQQPARATTARQLRNNIKVHPLVITGSGNSSNTSTEFLRNSDSEVETFVAVGNHSYYIHVSS